MATDTSSVNGMYDNQYAQPAELAASTPSHGASASQSSTTTAAQHKADPQEIGWYFVEQYYTTLSKSPERIHLFYSKKSQLVTGQEAEKVLPAVGTKAISEKIKSLDIQDCKVRVLNVDSQSSFDNIVVQVIGEMSNKSEPHHKFVQTFILATQPNGYFVLNDIFRYLNDEEHEIIEDESAQEELPTEQSVPEAEAPVEKSTAAETVTTEEAADKVDEKLEEEQEKSTEVEESTNGIDESVTDEPEPAEAAELVETKDPVTEATEVPGTENPPEPEHTPVESVPKAESTTEGPPAKKTWANMVGTKAPAIPALPQASVPAPAPAPGPAVASQPKTARPAQPAQSTKAPAPSTTDSEGASAQSNGWQMADHGKKTRGQQTKAVEGTVYAYIKNVNERVDARLLREVLEKFGDIKYYDVSRPKQSAFVEFVDPAGFAAAVAANPHTVGSEQISVEERRGRNGPYTPNAPFNRGAGVAGRGRGGIQQPRSGSQGTNYPRDNARGGFQQRGGKPGNVTPKGRGQTQAAQ